MSPSSLFFIFDAESIGLHGQTFAVAGGVYDGQGIALREFAYHNDPADSNPSCSTRAKEDRQWVADNVTIHATSLEVGSPWALRTVFWQEWERAKQDHPGIVMAVECGWPVEARFLKACINDLPHERNWEGPYPLHEIASIMLAAGMDPMATYERRPEELPAHEPLADARLSARLLATAISRLQAP